MTKALSVSVTFEALVSRVAALEAGPTFTGALTAPSLNLTAGPLTVGTHVTLTDAATYSQLNFTTTDAITFDRTTSTMLFYVGNIIQARLTSTNFMVTTTLNVGDSNYAFGLNAGNPVMLFDTNDYIRYDRTANKFYFRIGGTDIASIDASGNMKLAGTLTQSTTP